MGLFKSSLIKIDYDKKIIKLKDVFDPIRVMELIDEENLKNSVFNAQYKLELISSGLDLILINGWKFDEKTVSIYKQKDNRRYRNFRTSDSDRISSHFKRV